MLNEKEIALKISSKLEHLIKIKKIKAQEIANFIGIDKQLVSRNRQILKTGKFSNSKFLIGVSKFFNENFLWFLHVLNVKNALK